MNQISLIDVAATAGDDPLAMTSREIAELTGKEHRNVLRDIRVLQEQLGELFGGYAQNWAHPQNGQTYEEFILDKDTCLTLVLGYDAVARMKVVKRWQALETGKAQPAMAQNEAPQQIDKPDPQAFAVVQSAWVDAVERKIASKREALQFLRDASAVMIKGIYPITNCGRTI